jgi:uroporphyrinogen-III synthase
VNTAARPLAGRRIVVTREQPGELDDLLVARGAEVIHVPLITVEPVEVDLDDVASFDWLVVTSRHGASAVGAAAAGAPNVRLAAVGEKTAAVLAELSGRGVDLVPAVQRGDELVAAFGSGRGKVLVAQGDLADGSVVAGLAELGWDVEARVAYRTATRTPTDDERSAVVGADAVLLASGSAARAWVAAFGCDAVASVFAIGPSTAAAARAAGLKIAASSADHSVGGLVEAAERHLGGAP